MRLVVSFRTGDPDKTYRLQPPALWSAAELASAILCGCMPATAALFNHLAPKWSAYLYLRRPSGANNQIDQQQGGGGGGGVGVGGEGEKKKKRSSWKAPRAWNESSLLRSEEGEGGEEGMKQQVSHCSDEEARERVEEHLQWSGWRR